MNKLQSTSKNIIYKLQDTSKLKSYTKRNNIKHP